MNFGKLTPGNLREKGAAAMQVPQRIGLLLFTKTQVCAKSKDDVCTSDACPVLKVKRRCKH